MTKKSFRMAVPLLLLALSLVSAGCGDGSVTVEKLAEKLGKMKKSDLRQILAVNLKVHRNMLGLSQEKLAEMASLSWQTVNSIECQRTWVSDKTLESLAEALKIDTFQLLLPIETVQPLAISPNEALRKLNKVKRAFDDSFNEILNSVK
jgi:transcriptional regulator with XRE-family HTH domain